MSSDSEEDFEDQIRQEEQAKQIERDKGTDVFGEARTRRDDDGTEYEWDTEKKAWFPKIDADFIAQYQMSYGCSDSAQPSTEVTASVSEPSSTVSTTTSTTSMSTDDHYAYWYHYYSAANSKSDTTTTDSKAYEEYYKYCQQYYKWMESQQQAGTASQSKDDDAGTKTDSGATAGKTGDEDGTQSYSLQHSGKDTDWDAYWAQYYNYQPSSQAEEGAKDNSNSADKPDDKDKPESEKDGAESKKDPKDKKTKPDPTWFDVEEDKNTNVYVMGLPTDITEDEYKELMNKCGLVMFDPRTRKPKLKLYRDEKGHLKGDGLCCYIKSESVDLALQILDGSEMRGFKISVERAKFELKGSFDAKKRKKKLSNREKKKFLEKQAKLFDWRPDKPLGSRERRERVVIIKDVFVSKEIEDNPTLIGELSMDLRNECGKYGDLRKVVVYDRHPDGVASVTFKEAEEADVCIEAVNGRWFAKRQLTAETWDGRTKYDVKESEEERETRMKSWEKFLEKGEENEETSAKKAEKSDESVKSKDLGKDKESVSRGDKGTDKISTTLKAPEDSTEEGRDVAKVTSPQMEMEMEVEHEEDKAKDTDRSPTDSEDSTTDKLPATVETGEVSTIEGDAGNVTPPWMEEEEEDAEETDAPASDAVSSVADSLVNGQMDDDEDVNGQETDRPLA